MIATAATIIMIVSSFDVKWKKRAAATSNPIKE
jgi:hypothetical protein